MFKKAVETIVGGAVGILALCVVAKVAYDAGHEMARAEQRYQDLNKEGKPALKEPEEPEPPKSEPKPERPSPLARLGKIFLGKKSVVGRIVSNLDAQKVEMYVEGEVFRIDVKPRK